MSAVVMLFSIFFLWKLTAAWRGGNVKLRGGPLVDGQNSPIFFRVIMLSFFIMGLLVFGFSAWQTFGRVPVIQNLIHKP